MDDTRGKPFRLLITGGGTGGHVLPAIAVVDELRRRHLPLETLWIGSHTGLERDAAAANDIPFRAIQTGKLRRYLSVENVIDALRLPVGTTQAYWIARRFRPDVVFSTGGFVSVPAVTACARLAPILTHEQTAGLGLATRLNLRFADLLAVSYDVSLPLAARGARRSIVTGNPVRSALAGGEAGRGFTRFGFTPDLPLVYITGGARGASPLNQRVGDCLPALLESCQVVHQTGPASANSDAARLRERRATWPAPLQQRYHVTEFVGDELPDLYAAASLVIGRSGAGTVAELAYLGKPAILIPLPGTGGDEQAHNAALLGDRGAAVVIPQRDATPERLLAEIRALLGDAGRLRDMGDRARAASRPDAATRLADALLDLARRG